MDQRTAIWRSRQSESWSGRIEKEERGESVLPRIYWCCKGTSLLDKSLSSPVQECLHPGDCVLPGS